MSADGELNQLVADVRETLVGDLMSSAIDTPQLLTEHLNKALDLIKSAVAVNVSEIWGDEHVDAEMKTDIDQYMERFDAFFHTTGGN